MPENNFGVFRIEKVKLSDTGELCGRLKHDFREFENSQFDPELTATNEYVLCQSSQQV